MIIDSHYLSHRSKASQIRFVGTVYVRGLIIIQNFKVLEYARYWLLTKSSMSILLE